MIGTVKRIAAWEINKYNNKLTHLVGAYVTVEGEMAVTNADGETQIETEEVTIPFIWPFGASLKVGDRVSFVALPLDEKDEPTEPDEDRDILTVVGRGSYDLETDELHIEPDPDEFLEDRKLKERDR